MIKYIKQGKIKICNSDIRLKNCIVLPRRRFRVFEIKNPSKRVKSFCLEHTYTIE